MDGKFDSSSTLIQNCPIEITCGDDNDACFAQTSKTGKKESMDHNGWFDLSPPAFFIEKKKAMQYSKGHGGHTWSYSSGCSTHVYYQCGDHVGCCKYIRVKQAGIMWTVQMNGNVHSRNYVPGAPLKPGTTTKIKGIQGRARKRIKEFFEAGVGPQGCRIRLIEEVSHAAIADREVLISRVPSLSKIASLHRAFRNSKVGAITNGVELMQWCHEHLCLDGETA
ncbi:MAG: hypothetical protein ACREBR_01775, partial [bacterium]